MHQTSTDAEPKLAPPGAGVPWLERTIAGIFLKAQARRLSASEASAVIERERQRIHDQLRTAGGRCGTRVLIPRLRGLEDSSRFWSVFMVLDHLRIVNVLIAKTIASLGKNHPSARVIGTADVKPSPGADEDVVKRFADSCDAVITAAAGVADLQTPVRYPHPWFGPLNARQWHVLAGFHMHLHHGQIREILRRG